MDSIINFFHIVNSDFTSWQYAVAVFSSLILGNILIITSRYLPHVFYRYLIRTLGNFSWISGCVALLITATSLDNTAKGISGIIPLLFAVATLLLTLKLNMYAFPNKAQTKE